MDELVVGGLVFLILVTTLTIATSIALTRRGLRTPGKQGLEPISSLPDPQAPSPNDEQVTVENSKLVVHALLHSVSDNIESVLGDNARYSSSLEQHRSSLQRAMTVAGIKELERVLLSELDNVQATNRQYRQKLDDANARVTAQQAELEKLQADLGLDFLTKIPNRRAFDQRLGEELDRAQRYGKTCALVMMDIDFFKRINDTHGHLAGDRVLRAVAGLLLENKRSSDYLARYGGEEFAVILPETSLEDAKSIANKLRQKIEETKLRYESKTMRVTVSAGVGQAASRGDDPEAFFGRVDAALYAAKHRGRNRVEMAATGQS